MPGATRDDRTQAIPRTHEPTIIGVEDAGQAFVASDPWIDDRDDDMIARQVLGERRKQVGAGADISRRCIGQHGDDRDIRGVPEKHSGHLTNVWAVRAEVGEELENHGAFGRGWPGRSALVCSPQFGFRNMAAPTNTNPLAKLAVDLLPLIVFFVANGIWGIMPATIALMPATVIALGASYWMTRRFALLPVVTLGIVLILGGMTIALNDELFIKLKPTIVSALFAIVLFAGLALRRSLLKLVLGDMIPLTDTGWRILTVRWASFFLGLAVLNEIVWRSFGTDTWVSFKVFGITLLTVVFSVSQMSVLQRHRLSDSASPS